MNLLDARTVLISYSLTAVVCLIVLGVLWRWSRDRISGVGFWVADFALTGLAVVLLLLRDHIPDFVSIVVANGVVIVGAILLYHGLQLYTGTRVRQWHNWAYLAVFVAIHSYYTFVVPDIHARNVNVAMGLAFTTAQSAWFLLWRVRDDMKQDAWAPGVVLALLALSSVVRIALIARIHERPHLFDMGVFDTGGLLVNEVLYVALTFALLLMVTHRFTRELEADIDARRSAEEALQRSQEKFALAFQAVPDALLVSTMSDGVMLETNAAFEHIFGWTAAEVQGKTTIDMAVWADLADRAAYVERLLSERHLRDYPVVFCRRSGEQFPGIISAEVIVIEGQECILATIRDDTERAHAEQEIRRLNADLEERVRERTENLEERNRQLLEANSRLDEASAAKSRFLASMSHELRTPLNSVIGFSGMLSQGLVGEMEPEQLHQVQMINAAGTHLLELVDEVLDLAAIESGEMRIDYTQVSVDDLVRSVVQSVAPLAESRQLALSARVKGRVGTIVTDRVRVRQVLLNLLGNAIKFTEEGAVVLEAERTHGSLVLRVVDTGPGIAAEEQEAVFEEFYQVDRPGVAKAVGTGLGLPVSRRLVEMLGGTLELRSELGAGSTFIVTLPLADGETLSDGAHAGA